MRLIPAFAAASPLIVLLASCVAPPSSAPAPAPAHPASPPRPVQPAPPPAASPAPASTAWDDRALTPGTWRYRAEPAGSVASFGTADQPALLLRCDRATRRLLIVRTGSGQGPIVVRTSYGAVSLPAMPQPGSAPALVAARAASDPLLDQMAYSRGKIALEAPGAAMLVLPAWAEVARVVEDCRG